MCISIKQPGLFLHATGMPDFTQTATVCTHTNKQVIILLPFKNCAYPLAHNTLGSTAKAAVRQYYNVCQVIIQNVADNSPIISMFLWKHAAVFLLLHKAVKQEKITVILFLPCHTNTNLLAMSEANFYL